MARGAGYSIFLTGDETVLQLRKGKSGDVGAEEGEKRMADRSVESADLRMKLSGSNPSSRVSGVGKLHTTSNYFIGNDPAAWRRGVSNYSKVKYESVYPGIDMVWYGNQQMLEHDFLIAPGADPSRIKLSFTGTDKVSIDGDGALVAQAGGEDLRMLKPHAWQESNGGRRAVNCEYSLSDKNQVEFRLGAYDTTLPLVIDPVLIYSTYIGGIGTDVGRGIAVDAEGAAYITGQTDSTDFPGPSQIQSAKGVATDAYVLKINPAGDAIVFGAWIGGNGSDSAISVAVDQDGAVYLAGATSSSNFPLQNPLQNSIRGPSDGFVAKINSSGSALLYSTYIGGTGTDNANGLAVDADGNLYLTGTTDSIDFPVVNAFQPFKNGGGAYSSDNRGDSWAEVGNGLKADGNDLVISPFDSSIIFAGTDRGVFKSADGGSWNLLGGAQFIRNISQVIVDPTTPDILYAVSLNQLFKSIDGGATWVLKPISPVRRVAVDPTNPSKLYAGTSSDLFISANGGDSWTPVFIPHIGTGAIGPVESIAIDPISPATVYIGTSQGVYKSIDGGVSWAFAGSGLPIFFPPSGAPVRIVRIAISRSSPTTLYALADNATIFRTNNAGSSWFQLNTPVIGPPTISAFLFLPLAVAPDNSDIVYVGSRSVGLFRSVDGGINWNTINNGLNGREIRAIAIDSNSPEKVYAGGYRSTDAFVAKLNATGSSFIYSSYIGGGATEIGGPIAIDSTGAAYIAGLTNSPNFPVVNAFQTMTTGLPDAFVAKVAPSGSEVSWATYLGGSNFDNAPAIAVNSAGDVFVAGSTSSIDFPVNNAIQPSLKGGQDGFITRLRNDGSALDFSTYLGGAGFDGVTAIAIDPAGALYVTGGTTSLDFPVVSAVQSTRGGNPAFPNTDAFVTKMNSNGAAVIYSTYLGGGGSDNGNGIAVDGSANAYVTGTAFSIDFPTTPFPIRATGVNDAFVAKLGTSADLAITISGAPNPVMINNQLTYTLTVTNNGPDPGVGVRVTDTPPDGASLVSSAASQGSCSGASVINCDLGNLAAGSSATITIIVTPSSAGAIINGANVTSGVPDNNPGNNVATLETVVSLLPSIYGRVTIDGGAGVSGVTVAVDGSGRPPAVTAGDGYYQVSELTRGESYIVTPSRQGYVFHPKSREIKKLQSDRQADFGAVACSFSLSTTSLSFPATGGIGNVTLSSSDHQCAWTATSNAPWIRLISAPAGNGSGPVKFEVEPTVGSRVGSITIGGNKLTVLQEFNPCGAVTFNSPKILSLNGVSLGSGAQNIVAEDFNNDSVSDLVIYGNSFAFPSTSGLTISLSNSAGGYDVARPIFTGLVRAIRAGDLNKDGKNDLALTTIEEPARLLTLTGDGAGGFSAPVSIETGPSPIDLAITDVNSDGAPDLAVVTGPTLPPDPSQSNYNLAIHLGDGVGGFAAPRHISFTTSPSSVPTRVETGDFNGDGKPDLAVLASFGPAIIFTGDGAAGFTTSRLENVFSPRAMALGDFNGDSKTDLAISQQSPLGGFIISIWVSTAGGILQPAQPINILFEELLFAADINGDGKSDLLLRGERGISVLHATNNGKFAKPVRYMPGGRPGFTALGDFKKDGRNLRTDLFAPLLTFFPSTITKMAILTSDALRGFDAPRAFSFDPPAQPSSSGGFDIESGDLNGDGSLDVVIVPSGLPGVIVMYGVGRGEFGDPVSIRTGLGAFASNVELGDFNNDGKTDLAVLNSLPNVVVLLGDGQGGFTQSATFNTGILSSGLEPADFNKDGNLDLVVKAESGGLALFLGDGHGGFTQGATGIGGNLLGATFTSGDFNGDGAADLALSDSQRFFDNDLVILFGDGQGGFGSPIIVKTSSTLAFLFAVDLNHDGRDDLVYLPVFSDTSIFVVLGGPGGVSAPVQYPLGLSVRQATSDDVNGDGKPDLIAVSNVSGSVSILLGNGDGSFNQSVSSEFAEALTNIATGDFDQDGSIDLAVVRSFGSDVGILRNRSLCVPEGGVVPASAASFFRYRVARDSIVTLNGENQASGTSAAIPPFLPTSLANTRVKVKDSAGVERLAPLYSVSPDRITHVIPAQTSSGVALITVTNGGSVVAQGTALIAETAPGLFSADLSGQGYAAALVLRVRPDGSQVFEPVAQFDFEQNRFVAVPIDLSKEAEQVFLLLSGTGVRNHSGLANVRAKIGSENAEVTFAGAQGILPGADQVKLRLQPSLRGSGEVSVELSVDGRAANTVRIKIK
jgi:uncharacterized protein (TIGR03437 family)